MLNDSQNLWSQEKRLSYHQIIDKEFSIRLIFFSSLTRAFLHFIWL